MVNPKVSIITVVFNGVNTIEQTIKGVLDQTYKNIEYIIIDGLSTDGTLDVIEKYKEYIDCVISEADAGIYDAMNKGILKSTGELVGIINSDDWYEKDAIEKIVRKWRETDADLIYGNVMIVDKMGNREIAPMYDLETIWYQMPLSHPAVFIKRKIYEKYGLYDCQYKITADYELVFRLYLNGVKFRCLEDALAYFRVTGISSTNAKCTAREVCEVARKYLDYAPLEKKEFIAEAILNRYKASIFTWLLRENKEFILKKVKEECNTKEKDNIAIWGAGRWGSQIYDILMKNGMLPMHLVDGNETKWGTEIRGIKVESPQVLSTFDGAVLLVAKDYSKEIQLNIEKMNNDDLVCIVWEDFCENEVDI